MARPKEGISSDGRPMHYSVGALIERNGGYLLIDRKKIPYGFAGPAGHVDEGESFLEALCREVLEEIGKKVIKAELLYDEEVLWNNCSAGIECHYWHVYKCEIEEGGITPDDLDKDEANSFKWVAKDQLSKINLEPVWEYWFKKQGLID